jgi:hypothetical protein
MGHAWNTFNRCDVRLRDRYYGVSIAIWLEPILLQAYRGFRVSWNYSVLPIEQLPAQLAENHCTSSQY